MWEFIDYVVELVRQQINSNQFLLGGLILGALTSILYSLRSIPSLIWTRIERRIKFEVTVEQSDDLYPWVQNWMNIHYHSQLRSVKATFWRVHSDTGNKYGAITESNGKRNFQKENEIVYNHYGDYFVIWYNSRLIKISSQKEKMEHASDWLRLMGLR